MTFEWVVVRNPQPAHLFERFFPTHCISCFHMIGSEQQDAVRIYL